MSEAVKRLDWIPEVPVTQNTFFAHAPKQEDGVIDIVVDQHFTFLRMQSLQTTHILHQRPLPGYLHCQKEHVQVSIAESLANIAVGCDQNPFLGQGD